jgi:hypothetical protein
LIAGISGLQASDWPPTTLAAGSSGQAQQLVQQQPGQLLGHGPVDPAGDQSVASQNFAYQPPHHQEMMRQLLLYSHMYGADPRQAAGAAAGMLGAAGMEAGMCSG